MKGTGAGSTGKGLRGPLSQTGRTCWAGLARFCKPVLVSLVEGRAAGASRTKMQLSPLRSLKVSRERRQL